MTQEQWPAALVKVVAEQVQKLREARRMSAQKLADATAELGHPIPRSVIANLENGRRESITVAELVTLARALGVPPVLLVFPVGRQETTPVLPGAPVDTWQALKWFIGQGRFPSPYVGWGELDEATGIPEGYDDPEQGWEEGAAAIRLFLQHDEAVSEWWKSPAVVRRMVSPDDETAAREALNDRRSRIEDTIRQVRTEMRRRQLQPPKLAGELQHVDEVSA